jgi:glycosyltransferase involved in cell wall biosynthesis
MKKNTIFVQIASYRDPQLMPTLNDMFANAKWPKNLHLSICWQHGDDETLDMWRANGFVVGKTKNDSRVYDLPVTEMTREGAKLSVIDVHFHKTQGACWARNAIQQLYKKEKYTLQLDSHHRFAPNWDETLINMLESVRTEETPKPLLTAYIPSFDPENDPGARTQEPWKMDFDRFIPEGAVFFLPATIDNWQTLDKPVTSRFYSAHFCFADGSFAEEVQHDPQYFFHGEEIAIAARAYTWGYDLFHPHRPVIWHEYTRKGRVKVWDDHTTGQRNKGRVELDWVQRNDACHKRNRILFGMDGEDPKQIDFGKYGFGPVRTLRDYEVYAGISFKYRGVQQQTLNRSPNHHYPPNTLKYENEEQWADSIARSNDLRICLHRSELKIEEAFGPEEPDFDFFYVGAHDKDGNEIHRKDLQEHEIKNYLQHDFIDYRFIFMADRIRVPVTYTVWTHSKSKGWLTKIDKPAFG